MMHFLTVLAVVGGCSADKAADTAAVDAVVIDPLSWPVDAEGPFGVGYQSFDKTYSPGEGFADRTIRVNIWYPTVDTEGPSAEYTVGLDAEVMANAVPADPAHEGGFPAHVHSHGFQGYGGTSAFMARYFASHGIATIAPDHTNNTLIDNADPLGAAHYFHRPLDVRAALDAVEELDASDPLAGLIQTDAVMLSGHSFGAYTIWAAGGATYDLDNVAEMCATGEGIRDDGCTSAEEAMFASDLTDSRVVSLMPMAGTLRRAWFGSTGELSVDKPVLFMGGSNDAVGQVDQFEEMGDIDFTWMELEGGCHQTFALGSCTSLDPELGFHIVQTAALAFVRVTVLGDESEQSVGIISGEVSLSDIVTTKKR